MQIKPPITILLSTCACLMVASAQTGTWNTVTTPSSWETGSNWSGNIIASGSDNSANFNLLDITADTTVDLTTPRVIGHLNFGDTNTSTAGSWILSGGSNTLTLAGTSPTIYVNVLGTNKATTINAQLLGTSGFTKTGDGKLILNNSANTISGVISLSQGTLEYMNAGSLGTGSLSFTGNSTLRAGSTATVARAMNIGSGITATWDTNGFNATLSGALTGSGTLTKSGSGELKLTGGVANTFTGPIMVNQGTLVSKDGSSHKNLTGPITVASGASLYFGQNFSPTNHLINNLNLSGHGNGGYGALHLDYNANATGAITLSADTTISHDFNYGAISNTITATNLNLTLDSRVKGHAPLVINGNISLGTGTLTKVGVNSVTLNGTNSYSSMLITTGAVYFQNAASMGGSGANITIQDDGVAARNGTDLENLMSRVNPASTGAVAFGETIATASNALNMTTHPSLSIGSMRSTMTYSGTITPGGGNYRFGGGGNTFTVSSALTGTNGLIINDAQGGTVNLTGTLGYTGATVVKKGTLLMTASLSGSITVESPGALRLSSSTATGTIATSQAFVSNGTLSLRINRGQTQNSDRIIAASITLGGTLTIVNEGAALEVGDSFQLFSATGGISRNGLILNLPTLPDGLSWNRNNLYTTGILTVATTGSFITEVGQPDHPELLFSEIEAVYDSKQPSVRIRPGTYHMPRKETWEASFQLTNWKNFTIYAENVLITLDQQAGFKLSGCTNVTVKGCTIRGRLQSYTQGRIKDKGTDAEGYLWAIWEISEGYPTNFQLKEGYSSYEGEVKNGFSLNVVDKNTRYVNQAADDSYSNVMTPLGNNKWKVDFKSKTRPFNVDDWLVTRSGVYQTHVVYLSGSTNCTIDGVTSQGGNFATFYEYGGGGNKLLNCKIECSPERPPGALEDPVVSCAADGIHSRDAYPGLHIENLTTTGVLLDDIIAIHGFYSDITSVTGNTFEVYRNSMLKAGDRVRIYHENGYFAEANCIAVDTIILPSNTHPGTARITIDASLPIPAGSQCWNPKYDGAGYKIINCNLKGSRSRAIIAKADDGVISGNRISESQTAIRLGADYGGNESGWSWNSLIENNTIFNCRDAINMNADGEAIGNKDLTIRNNYFDDTLLTSMYIAGTDGVNITGNKFGRTNLGETVLFYNCKNVSFANNLVEYSSTSTKPFIKGASSVINLQGQNNGILYAGRAYALTNFLSNRLLANPLNNAVGGTVQQYTECNASGRWILQSNGTGYTKILSAANGLALGVNNSTSAGSSLVLENPGNGDGQLWTLEPSGATEIKLVNKLSGLHATVASTTVGESVKQAASTTSTGQLWTPSFNDYSYATWRNTNGGGVDPYGDDDKDGDSNIMEFALATDLVPGGKPTRERIAPINVDSVINNYGILELRRRANATDVSLTVLYSNDLVTWTPSAVLVSSVNNLDGTFTEIWREPNPRGDKGFLRVMLNLTN